MKNTIESLRAINTRIQNHDLLTINELRELIPAVIDGLFGDKIRGEIIDNFRKFEAADCDYARYAAQHAMLHYLGMAACETTAERMNFNGF